MTSNQIGRASSAQLYVRENALLDQSSLTNPETEAFDAIWSEVDEIRDELVGRAHDIEDPSSGLSLHQPS